MVTAFEFEATQFEHVSHASYDSFAIFYRVEFVEIEGGLLLAVLLNGECLL